VRKNGKHATRNDEVKNVQLRICYSLGDAVQSMSDITRNKRRNPRKN
jgi:hypothetical protein